MMSLIKQFRDKAGIKTVYNKDLETELSRLANNTTMANLPARIKAIKTKMAETDNAEYKTNPLLLELLNNPDSITLASVAAKVKANPSVTALYARLVGTLREIKQPEELVLLKKSV